VPVELFALFRHHDAAAVPLDPGSYFVGLLEDPLNTLQLGYADDIFTGSPPLGFTFGLGGLLLFPMRIGAAEGGRVFVFGLFGLDAATGLTLGLVRRIRELAWTAGGLTLYAWLARAPSRGALSETRASRVLAGQAGKGAST